MCVILHTGGRRSGKSWFVKRWPLVYIPHLYGGTPWAPGPVVTVDWANWDTVDERIKDALEVHPKATVRFVAGQSLPPSLGGEP
jgi:hypothetical protein